jgi:hypothetical protein
VQLPACLRKTVVALDYHIFTVLLHLYSKTVTTSSFIKIRFSIAHGISDSADVNVEDFARYGVVAKEC